MVVVEGEGLPDGDDAAADKTSRSSKLWDFLMLRFRVNAVFPHHDRLTASAFYHSKKTFIQVSTKTAFHLEPAFYR